MCRDLAVVLPTVDIWKKTLGILVASILGQRLAAGLEDPNGRRHSPAQQQGRD